MARGQKQVPGQITFEEFCVNPSHYVVQANALIGGKQALSINAAKIIRAAIMQVVFEDEALKPYKISISDLAMLLGIHKNELYRDINDITDNIIENPVYIKVISGKKEGWVKIPWVSQCEYNSDAGVAIQLNEKLKPYLLNLKERYTQYPLENILAMKSVYAIRIFELIQEKILDRILPKDGTDVTLSVETIRECCGCEDKYPEFKSLRARVIDTAEKEINRVTLYTVSHSYVKTGRSVTSIVFHVNMKYH